MMSEQEKKSIDETTSVLNGFNEILSIITDAAKKIHETHGMFDGSHALCTISGKVFRNHSIELTLEPCYKRVEDHPTHKIPYEIPEGTIDKLKALCGNDSVKYDKHTIEIKYQLPPKAA